MDVHGARCAKLVEYSWFPLNTYFFARPPPWTSSMDVHGGACAKNIVLYRNPMFLTFFAHVPPWTSTYSAWMSTVKGCAKILHATENQNTAHSPSWTSNFAPHRKFYVFMWFPFPQVESTLNLFQRCSPPCQCTTHSSNFNSHSQFRNVKHPAHMSPWNWMIVNTRCLHF